MATHDKPHDPSWRIYANGRKRVCRYCGTVQRLITGVWR